MNIRKMFSRIPEADTFLHIYIDLNQCIGRVLPEFNPHPEHCICIYGISETEMDEFLPMIENRAEKYAQKINETISKETAWVLKIKCVLLFEDEKCALLFKEFANLLDVDDFNDLITDIQLEYHNPWKHIPMIKKESMHDFIDHYKKVFDASLDLG